MPARKLRWRKDGAKNIPMDEACWQYMLDHAHRTSNDTFKIVLEFKSKDHFFSNLQARVEGRYRYSEEEVNNAYLKKSLLSDSLTSDKNK